MKANDLITEEVFSQDPLQFMLKELKIRVAQEHEYEKVGKLLDQEHYLGDLATGRRLVQVVEFKERWVALLDWGNAALKLNQREDWIGWTSQQRSERLNLIVMNRRFLILGNARMPNLASRSLALATRALPEHWKAKYGYSAVLAETFSDMEAFEGTCYKAAGWQECGQTKGYKRSGLDYYVKHDRPKKLWLKTLNRNARTILTSMDIAGAYEKAVNRSSPERDLALKKDQIYSLIDHLDQHFKDPRNSNQTYRASSLLVLIAMALFAGRDTMAAIHRYGGFLTQKQREWLSFPLNKDSTKVRKVPSYCALRNLLTQTDPHEFASCISEWLQANQGSLPRALAIDGKWIRDRALSLCLSEHETGAAVAVGFADQKSKNDQNKREGEQTVALRLYKNTNLENAVITGDALNNNQPQSHAVIEGGGDYFFQLKNENRHAYKNALKKSKTTPLFSTHKNPIANTDALISDI